MATYGITIANPSKYIMCVYCVCACVCGSVYFTISVKNVFSLVYSMPDFFKHRLILDDVTNHRLISDDVAFVE